MKRTTWVLALLFATAIAGLDPPGAGAAVQPSPPGAGAVGWYTPIRWQQEVTANLPNAGKGLLGQRKNTTWIRDRNRNFVDDLIDSTFTRGDSVDVAVDLNGSLPAAAIDSLFRGFGSIRYVGRILTSLLLNDVPVGRVDSLAAMPQVAMVEWQSPIYPAVVYSTREIQARKTTSYPPYRNASAEERSQFGQGVRIAILDTGVNQSNPGIPVPVSGFEATRFEDLHNANNPDPTAFDPNGIDDSCEPPPVGNGICTDADDAPNDGSSDPEPCAVSSNGMDPCGHATHVAGIALGRGLSSLCAMASSYPTDENAAPYCAGTATGADLVDIRVCTQGGTACAWNAVMSGLDWMIMRPPSSRARVANLSFEQCGNNDESGLLNAIVDYAVASGITVVAGNGNFGACGETATTPRQQSYAPASAPGAIAVAAVNDKNSIDRQDDEIYEYYLEGPRVTVPPFDPTVKPIDYSVLKPDVSAPGVGVQAPKQGSANVYETSTGTSFAAPHVSGVAAILIHAIESPPMSPPQQVNPGSIADLIRSTADPPLAMTPTYGTTDIPVWNKQFGMGIVNVGKALEDRAPAAGKPALADISFPNCVAPNSPGAPCRLPAPRECWQNDLDIHVKDDPPVANQVNLITTTVKNSDPLRQIDVYVNIGTYVFGVGTKQFYPLGRQRVSVPAGGTANVDQVWIPKESNHQCIQVTIDYGLDAQFWNNTTQRNIIVLPVLASSSSMTASSAAGEGAGAASGTETDMRVENPFFGPASFRIEATSSRKDWPCYAYPASFRNDPAHDLPPNIRIGADVRHGTSPGEQGVCQFRVLGTPLQGGRGVAGVEQEVGGVTLRVFVPSACEGRGVVVDQNQRPIPNLTVTYGRAILPLGVRWEKAARTVHSNASGVFRAAFETGVPYRFRLSGKQIADLELVAAPVCGADLHLEYGSVKPKEPRATH